MFGAFCFLERAVSLNFIIVTITIMVIVIIIGIIVFLLPLLFLKSYEFHRGNIQVTMTCSKSTIETREQDVKYV